MPEPGQVIADRYRLGTILGTGAAGVVYEARHELIGRKVALKWLYPHFAANEVVAARFLREARAACTVDHPNVVEVYDAGRDRDSLFLVMERLYGEPLSDFLERGVARPQELVATLIPALRGVAAAHRKGVIHRDLKPDNIYLARARPGRPGGAKVLDFGISKLRNPQTNLQLTTVGSFIGSPYYMAPEQLADSSTVDARADIYSLGVMLYEGLTGSLPYESESLAEIFVMINKGDARPLDDFRNDVPTKLSQVIRRAMDPEASNRFDSIEAFAVALEPFSDGLLFRIGSELEDLTECDDENDFQLEPDDGTTGVDLEQESTQVAEEDVIAGEATQLTSADEFVETDHGDDKEPGRDTDESVEKPATGGAIDRLDLQRAEALAESPTRPRIDMADSEEDLVDARPTPKRMPAAVVPPPPSIALGGASRPPPPPVPVYESDDDEDDEDDRKPTVEISRASIGSELAARDTARRIEAPEERPVRDTIATFDRPPPPPSPLPQPPAAQDTQPEAMGLHAAYRPPPAPHPHDLTPGPSSFADETSIVSRSTARNDLPPWPILAGIGVLLVVIGFLVAALLAR